MKRFIFILMVFILVSDVFSADSKDVAITIYNDNLALVREVRPIEFQKGIFDYRYTDVPSKIDPTSVHFSPRKSANKIAILEQNYQYDLVSSDKIFEKYIDNKISAIGKNGQAYEGTLLSYSSGSIVVQGNDGSLSVVRTNELTDFRFEKLPKGLLTKPTLVWKFDSDASGAIDCETSFLTEGINWHAEYVAVVAEDDKSLELSGWVSIDNRSGGSFNDARVKLMAGEIHRAEPQPDFPLKLGARMARDAEAAPQFEEKEFFEYHLYTLQRKATILNNEIKQITLFPSSETRAEKVFTFEGQGYRRNRGQLQNAKVTLEFKNSSSEGLGMPLPKGKVRVYKMDSDKSLEFIGEDNIDHTPKDEMVRIYVGDAFDVLGERKRADRNVISERVSEETIEISLRNHKSEDVEVVVVERLYGWGDWEIIKKSHDYHKKDANTIEFTVPVESDGETVINYTVRYRR